MTNIVSNYGLAERLDLSQLRYFRAIASCKTMMAAAKLLRISQPTLSVAMKNLELELGTSLFLRGPKGVELTRTGQELVRSTEEVFLLLQRTAERIHGLETGDVGRYVVGCYHSLGA